MKTTKTIIFITVLLITIITAHAQNLVPNPSFEECDTCPYGSCQIHYAKGWHSCSGTPDYFNTCAFVDDFSVPNNALGYQMPQTGNAYINIGTYIPSIYNGREYICTELSEPLEIGRDYYVSFNVSLIDRATYANNKIGVLFTNQNCFLLPCYYENENFELLNPQNHAHLYTDEIIVDTANWTNISGWFTADSTYNYMMIGNFFDDENINRLFINYGNFGDAAYFFDDIYVGKDSLTDSKQNNTEFFKDNITVFPNPTKSFCQINLKKIISQKDINIRLLDITGKDYTSRITTEKQNSNTYKIETKDIPNGIYVLEIASDNIIYNSKLVVTN
jgi:hypothetical protein